MSGINSFFTKPSGLAELVGNETKPDGFEAVWKLAEGTYPGVVVAVSDLPYATGPGQFTPKGSLRVTFFVYVFGTAKFLAQNGITGPDNETIKDYCLRVSRNLPLSDNHPPVLDGTGNDAKRAEWTKTLAGIAPYRKAPGTMVKTSSGIQTFFGTFVELKATKTDLATNAVALVWDKVAGAKCMVAVDKDGYANTVYGKSLDDDQWAELNKESESDDYLVRFPRLVLTCKKSNRKPKGAGAGTDNAGGPTTVTAPPQTPVPAGMQAFFKTAAAAIKDVRPDLYKTIQPAIQHAASIEGTTAVRLTELHTPEAQNNIVKPVVVMMVTNGIEVPPAEGNEPWATFVRNVLEAARAKLNGVTVTATATTEDADIV